MADAAIPLPAYPSFSSNNISSSPSRGRKWKQLVRPLSRKPTIAYGVKGPDEVCFGSILPILSRNEATSTLNHIDLLWYERWVCRQLREQPNHLFKSLLEQEESSDPDWIRKFAVLWNDTSQQMCSEETPSIDGILQSLITRGIIHMHDPRDTMSTARALIFAIIGWQTMLYRPDFGSSPLYQFLIVDELDGYQCHSRMELKQKDNMCKRPVNEFLMGFGILLPPKNFNPSESAEDKKAFNDFKIIEPSSCNAFVLTSIGRLTIKWIDSLSCHLELDQGAKILFLYRYPSFCFANMKLDSSDKDGSGTLHACASKTSSSRPWATDAEISQLLIETVTTYRLLFGQTKSGRQHFRQLHPFAGLPDNENDSVLAELCGRKHGKFVNCCSEREVYDLARDFPIYRARLAVIQRHLSMRQPRTWSELWKDRRDSAQWFTFWAVLIIGGLGILFAFLQVVLQIVQIALSTKTPSV